MKKSIATIVAGVALSASLISGNSARANHLSCEEVAKLGVARIKSLGSEFVELLAVYNHYSPGVVSPDEYDKCLIKSVEKGAPEYTVWVIKKDPSYGGGTTYRIIKKNNS